jgi:oligoribonuclease NrnB/cAMP/cGMP phosphodiesterase (DHH superfamily)
MRLVTRGNLDGLACAVLITEAEKIDSIELIHPQDITDDKFRVRSGDILANLPYHSACAKWFDHHSATRTYEKPPTVFEGRFGPAPSTSRLVFEYYRPNHPDFDRFTDFLRDVDRFDSADLQMTDVTDPQGYLLIGFTMDPRTGLGDFKEYFFKLLEAIRGKPLAEVLALPEVRERAERIAREREEFLKVMRQHSRQVGSVILTDLREVAEVPAGNRFLIYTLFPEANVSVRLAWGPGKKFAVATVGHSIFNRTCPVHVGELMAKYGGGGHRGAGATPLAPEHADRLVAEIVEELQRADPGSET